MKIAHYLNHTQKANGHVAVAVDLACEQATLGHDVYMVAGPGDFDEILTSHGVKIVRLSLVTGPLPLRLARMVVSLLPSMIKVRPDVVNAHMVAAAVAAKVVQPLVGYKLVTTVHNSFDPQAPLMRLGNRVIAVSDAVRREMIGKGIAAEKLRTIRNGTIGSARRSFYPERRLPLDHPAIVTVAGLHPRKGINRLIEAFALIQPRHPNAHLYIVGEGPYRAAYETQARNTGYGDHIHFLGHHDDPREVIASAEIFALASLADPCPLVIAEARQMGCAVVATHVGGIPEAVGGPDKALLVPPDDAVALSAALDRLLSDDRHRQALAAAAATDLDALTVRRVASMTLAVYQELVPGAEGELARTGKA